MKAKHIYSEQTEWKRNCAWKNYWVLNLWGEISNTERSYHVIEPIEDINNIDIKYLKKMGIKFFSAAQIYKI